MGVKHDYGYDARGNITSYGVPEREYTYDTARPHQVRSIANPQANGATPWTFDYDAAGNVVARSVDGFDQTFVYDSDHRIVSVDDSSPGAGASTFKYSADGARVVRATPTSLTYYAFGLYEYELDIANGAQVTERHNYMAAGEMVAVREQAPGTDEFTWMFSDHQGSASAFLNTATGASGMTRYYPFGHERVISGSDVNPTDYGYGGHINDRDTGLLYMGARYYDQQVGRFMSPDPLIPDATNPADWNPYSYVRNSPINLLDPSGREPESAQESYAEYLRNDGFSMMDFGSGLSMR